MQETDQAANIRWFLDDTYFVGTPEAVEAGITTYKRELGKLGMKLNDSKTKVWAPGFEVGTLPQEFEKVRVQRLKVTGALVPFSKKE